MYAVKIGASPEHVWVDQKSYENCNFFWWRAKSGCFGHQKLWKVEIGINSQNSLVSADGYPGNWDCFTTFVFKIHLLAPRRETSIKFLHGEGMQVGKNVTRIAKLTITTWFASMQFSV
jgi:hypothetical protein